jgi:hypothetical protein
MGSSPTRSTRYTKAEPILCTTNSLSLILVKGRGAGTLAP